MARTTSSSVVVGWFESATAIPVDVNPASFVVQTLNYECGGYDGLGEWTVGATKSINPLKCMDGQHNKYQTTAH